MTESRAVGLTGPAVGGKRSRRVALVAGLFATLAIVAVGLSWAKWVPYTSKIAGLADSRAWPGSDILSVGDVQPGDPPSWHAAWSFTFSYARDVWKALAVALLIRAALQAFVPKRWLLRVLARPGLWRRTLTSAAAATPSMMCTCCTAPVAVSLREQGVPRSSVVAYWLGNPMLNPAVLVFFLLVAPWQWTVTRFLFGVVMVIGTALLVARFAAGEERIAADQLVGGATEPRTTEPGGLRRFVRSLARTLVLLLPEYLVVVLLLGAFRGWLFPLGGTVLSGGVLVLLLSAAVGTLLVIPTGGEIPVTQGLALAGMSLGAIGALLVTLPAVSLPGMLMVGRALGLRATVATALAAAGTGVLAGVFLVAIS
jgi:uncharacterized membrane protein YraQ (UPF0718 family)